MIDNNIGHDPIEHVVVLMLENHSFDQILGCCQQIYSGLEGVDLSDLKVNKDTNGTSYQQLAMTERRQPIDPHHEVEHVKIQMSDDMQGFLRDFSQAYPQSTDLERQYVMGYYPFGFLPATHTLAANFLILDRFHSSVPGPTWPNRFFALSGTSLGRVSMPYDGQHQADILGYFQQDQDTICDRLNEKQIPWKFYFHDLPLSWIMDHQRRPENAAHYFPIDQFFKDANGDPNQFPEFSYIEPRYRGSDENDDHPPHDLMKGQKLIADVYNALRANEELWNKTLLILTYDEHGGFYDHILPPAAIAPDDHHEEYTFDQLGVRVPTILISPWVKAGYNSTVFDHTSILKYLIDKWGLNQLGKRTAVANSIAPLIAEIDNVRTDTPLQIVLTPAQLASDDPDADKQAGDSLNDLNKGVLKLLSIQLDLAIPTQLSWLARQIMSVKKFFSFSWFTRSASAIDLVAQYAALLNKVSYYLMLVHKNNLKG